MFIGKVVKIRDFVFNQMPLKLLSVGSPSWCWSGKFCGVSHSMWYMRGSSHWWSNRSCFRDILLPLLTLMLPIQSRVITITSALLWYLYFLGASIKGLGQYRYFSCIVMYSGPDSVPIHWLGFLCLRGVLIGRHHCMGTPDIVCRLVHPFQCRNDEAFSKSAVGYITMTS